MNNDAGVDEHKANEPNDANDPQLAPSTPKKQCNRIDPMILRTKALEVDAMVVRCALQYGGEFTLLTPSTSSRPRQGASPGAGTSLGPIMHCADHPGILIAHFAFLQVELRALATSLALPYATAAPAVHLRY